MEKVIQIRLSEEEYENLEFIAEGENMSNEDVIKEAFKEKVDRYIEKIRGKIEKEKDQYISLEEYGKRRGLE